MNKVTDKKISNKSKKKMDLMITFFMIFIIIAASILIFIYAPADKKESDKKEPIIEIDERISPLVNQGLGFEILRIRHRGLYEALKTRGNAWKTKPTFYFISNIDGLEYVSKDVTQHSASTTVYFNTWDSIFKENKIVKDSEEEQEKSKVSLQLVEVVSSGFLGRKTSDIVRDEFSVTYDYRTGRWAGDDNFKDSDGYGYYLGETFEIWFNLYPIDYDRDYIPYWTEVNVLGTDPTVDDSRLDPDEDGVSTYWEWKWGYDPFVWDNHERLDPDIDGLENIEEYKMAKYFADPFTQNVYVEVDFMEKGGFNDPPHVLPVECQQAIIEKYADHNIKLIFDAGWPGSSNNGGGEYVEHYERISQDGGQIAQYYYHHFADERKGIFRYMVIGHKGGFNHPGKGNFYDCTYIPDWITEHQPFKKLQLFLTLGIRPTQRGQTIALAAVTMHELGHSIGLSWVDFQGIDNLSYNMWFIPGETWKNTYIDYESVMNYYWMYSPTVLDYSDGSNGEPHDQNDWGQLFVPTFQYNKRYIEEPGGTPIVIDSENRFPEGYTLDKNLTEEFNNSRNGIKSPVDPIEVEWKVFIKDKNNEETNTKDIKVFVKPKTPSGKWVLSYEGDLDCDGKISFYSKEDLFEKIYEYYEKEKTNIDLII